MPTYIVNCQECGETFSCWQSIHADAHERHCDAEEDPCPGTLVRVIQSVRTYGVGERGKATVSADAREARLSKDRDAYKRFRDAGHQPVRMHGADHLEAIAENDWFVKTGGVVSIPEHKRSEVEEQLAEAPESGWSPVQQVREAKRRAGKPTDVPADVS